MKILLVLFFLTYSLFAINIDVSSSVIANGKTALVEFTKQKDISYEKIIAGKKSYKIYQNPLHSDRFYALVPISYYEKPSNKTIEVVYKEDK